MLHRLGAPAHEHIFSTLLQRGDPLAACRAVRQLRLTAYPPRPLLDAAASHDDPTVFATVDEFLQLRSRCGRGASDLLPEEGLATERCSDRLQDGGAPSAQ